MSGPGGRWPFSKRVSIVHAVLALFTLGLWLLVPAAILTWRRGGAMRKISYGLWGVITILVLSLGFSLGASEETVEAAADTATVTQPVTVTVTEPTTPPPSATAAPRPKPTKPRTFLVAEVVDGDTIKLANGRRIRLVQIDAPERDGECFGAESRQTLTTLLPRGTSVRLEYDARLDKVDRFGRDLVYVFKGRENVNRTLVLRGAASVWFFEGVRGRYATALEAAARDAEAATRGLWRACSATVYDAYSPLAARKPAPPPPVAPIAAPVASPAPVSSCHPSYEGQCLDPSASDYDCAGGSGNGPEYTGPVRVVGDDVYGLDRDGDGYACE